MLLQEKNFKKINEWSKKMIRIDVSKIKNWELIKKKHSEWYEEKILPSIKKAYNLLSKSASKTPAVKIPLRDPPSKHNAPFNISIIFSISSSLCVY